MPKQDYRQALIDKIGISVAQANVMADSVNTANLSAGTGDPVL